MQTNRRTVRLLIELDILKTKYSVGEIVDALIVLKRQEEQEKRDKENYTHELHRNDIP